MWEFLGIPQHLLWKVLQEGGVSGSLLQSVCECSESCQNHLGLVSDFIMCASIPGISRSSIGG